MFLLNQAGRCPPLLPLLIQQTSCMPYQWQKQSSIHKRNIYFLIFHQICQFINSLSMPAVVLWRFWHNIALRLSNIYEHIRVNTRPKSKRFSRDTLPLFKWFDFDLISMYTHIYDKFCNGWVHVLSRLGACRVAVGDMSRSGWVHVLKWLAACLVVGCYSCSGRIFPETVTYFEKQSYISRNSRIFPETAA